MSQLVNCRLRISLVDGRLIIGQLLAYDKHMNLVVADCEEFRLHNRQKLAQQKSINAQTSTSPATPTAVTPLARRALGMIILRGEEIVTISTESAAPPRSGNKARIPASQQQQQQQQQPLVDAPSTAMFVRPGMPPGQF